MSLCSWYDVCASTHFAYWPKPCTSYIYVYFLLSQYTNLLLLNCCFDCSLFSVFFFNRQSSYICRITLWRSAAIDISDVFPTLCCHTSMWASLCVLTVWVCDVRIRSQVCGVCAYFLFYYFAEVLNGMWYGEETGNTESGEPDNFVCVSCVYSHVRELEFIVNETHW